jgi:hypothetical protein
MLRRILLDPQGGEGTGTIPDTLPDNPKGTPDLTRAIESLLSKYGPDGAVGKVIIEAHDLRKKVAALKSRVPKEGAVILEGDDARRWSSYVALGEPDALRAGLAERDTFKAEAEGHRKAKLLAAAAGLYAYEPSVLETLAKDLEVEIREDRGQDGKPVKVAIVKGEGDKTTPLNEYAEAHWQAFLPALKAEAARRTSSPSPSGPPPVPNVAPSGDDPMVHRLRRIGAGSF